MSMSFSPLSFPRSAHTAYRAAGNSANKHEGMATLIPNNSVENPPNGHSSRAIYSINGQEILFLSTDKQHFFPLALTRDDMTGNYEADPTSLTDKKAEQFKKPTSITGRSVSEQNFRDILQGLSRELEKSSYASVFKHNKTGWQQLVQAELGKLNA